MSIDLHIHSSNSDGTDKIEDILNMLGPTEVVQHQSNFQPYMDDDLRSLGNQFKLKFQHAVTTGHSYDWDDHNKSKSIYHKTLNLARNKYFTTTLTKTRQIWNILKP